MPTETVLDLLRADWFRGWKAFVHLDRSGRAVKLYLQKGERTWRVGRSVPLVADQVRVQGKDCPWEHSATHVVWRVDCDRPQLWRGLEPVDRAEAPLDGMRQVFAAIVQGAQVKPKEPGGHQVALALALRAALPPRYLDLYDAQDHRQWPDGGPLVAVVWRLEQLAWGVDRTATADAAQLYATLQRARDLLEAKRLRAAA